MMSQRALTALVALAGLAAHPALAAAAAPQATGAHSQVPIAAPAAAGTGYHRIELPGATGQPFPYTVEVPVDWQVHHLKDSPGIWLGPADAQPPDDPRLVYVRISRVPLADPAETVASIKANDAADSSWAAPLAEVREVGGVKGILVQMDSGAGDKARSTLTLKMPLPKTSVDFIGGSRTDQFARLRPTYERVLFSVRPAPAPPAPGPAGKP